MAKKDLGDPSNFINRELSWLEFNDRVLREGCCEELPLLERLKFLSIVSSNLDEFFMVRVAGLIQQRRGRVRRRGPSGMTPNQQLEAIHKRVGRMVSEQSAAIADVFSKLRGEGLDVSDPSGWTVEQRAYLRSYFSRELLGVLTPIAIQDLDPKPHLNGLQLHVALLVEGKEASVKSEGEADRRIILIPVPRDFPRFIDVPSRTGTVLACLEDVIASHAGMLLPGAKIVSSLIFRITRDGDVEIHDDEAADLLNVVERAVLDRNRSRAVRLELSKEPRAEMRKWFVEWLDLRPEEVYEVDGMMGRSALMEVSNRRGFEGLKVLEWPAVRASDLMDVEDLWGALQEKDVLLFHPYERFDSVVELMAAAAEDPNVLAIKQTLYRTSGDSPVVRSLEKAAQNGKQVTVLVELKARFDEARNVVWARRLEDAGCLVIYGIAGFKTHSKALLIVRREATRIRRYVHLATGNYNDKTAKLYSDLGLMTTDNAIATDVSSFFNLLTGRSEVTGWSEITIAPTDMRRVFLDLIDRESQISTADQPGLILAKVNSLQDPEIIQALYRASRAGVKIRLNVRGICCLRPGLKKISENIKVVSIVDRYLEHSRIFYFQNGGHEEVYLSSADWMARNLDKRLELLFPVKSSVLQRRLRKMLDVFFRDNVKSWQLGSDGEYVRKERKGKAVRAQEQFYQEAVEASQAAANRHERFQPMKRPES